MAMYYYARKLQKSARKVSKPPPPPERESRVVGNGSVPNLAMVGSVIGSGSGAACASPPGQNPGQGQQGHGLTNLNARTVGLGTGNVLCSSNSSTTTDSNTANSAGTAASGSASGSSNNTNGQPTNNTTNLTCAQFLKPHNNHQHQNQPSTSVSLSQWDNYSGGGGEGGLIYEDGNLVSGRLECLVEHLVPKWDYYPDRAYIFAFVLSSRQFIQPHELLATVFHRAFLHKPENEGAEVKVVLNLVQLLGEWAEIFPYDFRDDNGMMMANVRAITQKCVLLHPPVKNEVSILLTSLLARLTALEKFESMLYKISMDSVTYHASTSNAQQQARALAICPDANLLAEQLTHIELERFSFIGAQEYLQAFLKEPSPPSSTSSAGDFRLKEMKKTRLESYVHWFHRLSLSVATDVCTTSKKKLRARCIEFWVEVARECFNIGNFNSLMAIVTGLNMSPVARLKKTWGKLGCDLLSSLEQHMDPSNNFATYRSILKSAVWHSSNPADGRQKVVIPFFSLLIKDLYFLKEECAMRLSNGHINFEKFLKFGRQVGEIISWQQATCPFPKVPTIINSIYNLPSLSQTALLLASFESESPDGSPEKMLHKSLLERPILGELVDPFQRLKMTSALGLPDPASIISSAQSQSESPSPCLCLPVELDVLHEEESEDKSETTTTTYPLKSQVNMKGKAKPPVPL